MHRKLFENIQKLHPEWILHALCWLAGFIFFWQRGRLYLYPYYGYEGALLPALINGTLFNMALFYAATGYYLPQFFRFGKINWKLAVGFGALLMGLIAGESYLDNRVIEQYFDDHCPMNLWYNNNLPVAFLMLLLAGSYYFFKDRWQQERLKRRLIEENLWAELRQLKLQINPHFLFNTLNNLYTLARKKSDLTADGIAKLSQMMRYMLAEENVQRQTLDREIEFLQHFIHLQRLRISDQDPVEICFRVEDNVKDRPIAPLLLIPFVENAFKHGISLQYPSFIHIDLRMEEDWLNLQVVNSVNPQNGGRDWEHRPGIGLDNVRRRLDLLYSGLYDLVIKRTADRFSVNLKLKLI